MVQRIFTVSFSRFAGVFFLLLCLSMVHATATLENPVYIKVSGSVGSSTTGNKWNCVATAPPTRKVRFQSVTINGTVYDRTLINHMSLTSGGDVVQKNFTAADLGTCLLAAGRAGVDAICYNNSVCSGYTIKTTLKMCPCSTDADTLVFLRKNKTSSARQISYESNGTFTSAVVYSDILANIVSSLYLYGSVADCEGEIAAGTMNQRRLYYMDGSCYLTGRLTNASYCTSCTGKLVTVLTATSLPTFINFLDICGTTVTVSSGQTILMPSHAGYGCTYYPQLTTAADCAVSLKLATGLAQFFPTNAILSLASSGTTCNDEVVVYNGTSTTGTEISRSCSSESGVIVDQASTLDGMVTFVFKRKPPVTGASPALGFYVIVTTT